MAKHARGDVGATLREARERRGLSLRQISNSTKIAMMTLEALERNDIARLPGGIFSRSFVRAYAVEVGLEPEVMIEQFMSQFPQDSVTAGHPTSSRVEDHEAVESERRTASTLLRLVAISIPVAAVVVYFGTAGRRAGRQQSPVDSPQSAVTSLQSPVGSQQVAPGSQPVAPGNQPSAVGDRQPAPSAPTGIAVPAPALELAASVPADRFIVKVTAARPSWISAIVDGSRAAQREFKPGEEVSFEVHKEIVLTVGDAGGVSVTFNGLPTKPLGGNGQVVTWRVNLANFKTYLVTP
jgi:cytoskeleton protein RodZ